MKSIKKIVAALLVGIMAVSFCACHKKGEIAYKANDIQFTSGYYACAFLEADAEARSQVQSDLSTKGQSTEDIQYSKQKVDGKAYDTWVKDRTEEILKEIAAYEIKCRENKLTPDATAVAETERFFNEYWEKDMNGVTDLSTMYQPNGVSKETAIKFCTEYASSMLYQMQYQLYYAGEDISSYKIGGTDYQSLYYDYLYGEEGKEAPTEDEMNKHIKENYVLVGKISIPQTTTDATAQQQTAISEDEIKDEEKKANGYADTLKKDATQFETVYHQNAGDKHEEEKDADKDAAKPLTEHAQVIGKDDANYEKASAMKNGEVTVIGLDDKGNAEEDASELTVLLRLDLNKDTYYLNDYRTGNRANVVYEMKHEGFEKAIADFVKTLKCEEVKSSTKQFKTKKIKYPGDE